jgi:hypothetical protein
MPNIPAAGRPRTLQSAVNAVPTLDDLRQQPDRLVFLPDLVSMRILRSYGAARRWVQNGRLPEPYRLATGKAWEGRDVLKAIGAQAKFPDVACCAARQGAAITPTEWDGSHG